MRSTDKSADSRHLTVARATPSAPALPSPGEAPALDPRLVAELSGPGWETSWELTPSIHTTAADPGARQRLWTLGEMIRPHVRDAFALSDEPRALDLQSGEGWIAQRLLQWGARHVVAVDDRPDRLRRARLLRDHFAIGASQLTLVEMREWSPPEREDRFDVLVLAGAPERARDEQALARARASTRSVCVLECEGSDTNLVAETALAAGFRTVDRLRPTLQGAPAYVLEELDVLIAKVGIGG
jgi:hypothetical protein